MKNGVQSAREIRWADSGPVWRERIFWMAAGILVLWYLALIINNFEQIAFCFAPAWQRFYIYGFFIGWPILVTGFLVARGYLNQYLDFWFFRSRPRLIALWLLLSVLGSCSLFIAHDDNGHFYFAGWQAWEQGFFPGWLNDLEASALPLFLLIWLLPIRNNRAARAAELSTSNFDLSTALENWRNELTAQPQLTADDRRELERHLADSINELCRQGLGEEESFRQACQRIGSPRQLAEEFEKADPAKVWRERTFWAAVGVIVFWQLKLVISYFVSTLLELAAHFIPALTRLNRGNWNLFPDLVFLLGAILMIKGRPGRFPILAWFFQSRVQLAILLVLLAALCSWGQSVAIWTTQIEAHRHPVGLGTWIAFCLRGSFRYLKLGLAPLILAVWFLPKRFRKAPRLPKLARS